MSKKLPIINLLLLAFVAGSFFFLSYTGKSSRVYSGRTIVSAVKRPESAFFLWRDSGVKGRLLFHFDRRIHADTQGDQVTASNYIDKAARQNLVRAIYHVIPDVNWDEAERNLRTLPQVQPRGKSYRLTVEGLPIFILPLKEFVTVQEPVIVNVNTDWWTDSEIRSIAGLLREGRLHSDLITVSGKASESYRNLFESLQ